MSGAVPPCTGRVFGYARASTGDQNLDRQIAALGEVDMLIEDKESGKNVADRDELSALMRFVKAGDNIRVKSADRLARSSSDLLAIAENLKSRKVGLEFVDNPALKTTTPQGYFMLTVLAAVAQLEREIILERQAEGIALAKKKGKYTKAPRLTRQQVLDARRRVAEGVPKAQVARDLQVSRPTLYAALSGTGVYADGGRKDEDAEEPPLW
ncbi:recombinase family protein [Corynebacterium heidelbergense]|uniref:Transposase n=1 Tax=Corynebacterium heidelbergense TaxID=2055947 RepID=A0A364VEA0_9CORY|nr:recombinase family protein [Corynebacterium heidelbergense]RAV34975.1 transposase [Corynebacterium heidelbergense]WCZ35906.1 Transposon Tn3 resolvase [Corynebacterium heidelbergense]